ncbi:MAG: sodium/calcium exchanger rane region [Bryobacterales bacterium]|nr:sodium/calcium exchanger rane region [Bryobacterales bacterium]
MLAVAGPIAVTDPLSILWTGPSILLASMLIAWGAESAQFFMAQGFALVILAWMQTLPEFALEADLAWHQRTELLIANLTGAIRLLTGIGWPLIYATAAVSHRARYRKPLKEVSVSKQQSVQVVGVLFCLLYVAVISIKGSLNLLDAALLICIYGMYIWTIRQLPAEESESVEELGAIPRGIVAARRPVRIASIALLFLAGGGLIFFAIDPFIGSLFALASALGMSQFIFIQWIAPLVSEFPEQVSAFYWARSIDRASLALMNMVSSNITQWTLLAALLPVVLSLSRHAPSTILFDYQQNVEILMTLGQSLLGALFLISMRLAWWEAAILFVLWAVQIAFSVAAPSDGFPGYVGSHINQWTIYAYFACAAFATLRLVLERRKPQAIADFAQIWKDHVR